jgi:Uma2 family endonuclease
LGETDQHRILMTDLIFALRWFLRNVRAYVAGNLFVYFEEGNPRAVVAPDVFVVLDAQPHSRRIYQTWREGGLLPSFVIELTSKKTAQADQQVKPELYARLGIQEYVLFDPFGEYLQPRLQGFRLVQGRYEAMREYPLRSTMLGVELRQENNDLRLYDARTGLRLPTSDEEAQARRAAEHQLRAERQLRTEAEARAAAEAERAAAEAERATAEAERANAAEAELARLRAELARATQGQG